MGFFRFFAGALALAMLGAVPARAAEPKAGGTLIFGRGGDSVGLDPAARTDGESFTTWVHRADEALLRGESALAGAR